MFVFIEHFGFAKISLINVKITQGNLFCALKIFFLIFFYLKLEWLPSQYRLSLVAHLLLHPFCFSVNPLSANPTKWLNTLKQFVGNSPTNCMSVLNHFVWLALKELVNALDPNNAKTYLQLYSSLTFTIKANKYNLFNLSVVIFYITFAQIYLEHYSATIWP